MERIFHCKKFSVLQEKSKMKVNTDGILLGAWVKTKDIKHILDIGTGTGIISLMLAQRIPSANIIGVEIDKDSAKEAAYNFSQTRWNDRLKIIPTSIQEYMNSTNSKFDLIVSNPPFFTGGTFSENENRNNVRQAIKLSHGDLLVACNRLLAPEGTVAVILPYLEGERFIERASRLGLYEKQVTEVISRPGQPIERLLITLSKNGNAEPRTHLHILDPGTDRGYSNAYKSIVKDFYTIF